MTLYDICLEIAEIEEGLMYGQINFTYDNLMSAMKPGHPADLLDDVLSEIGWDVFEGKEVSLARVEETCKALKRFRTTFKVKELASPIKHLTEYIKAQKQEEN